MPIGGTGQIKACWEQLCLCVLRCDVTVQVDVDCGTVLQGGRVSDSMSESCPECTSVDDAALETLFGEGNSICRRLS